jgi:hypothetical protein
MVVLRGPASDSRRPGIPRTVPVPGGPSPTEDGGGRLRPPRGTVVGHVAGAPWATYRRSMTEQQRYEVVRSLGRAELRRYAPHVVAEVAVDASFRDAGNRAFRSLAAYIGGANRARRGIASTDGVVRRDDGAEPTDGPASEPSASSERVAMTAPVLQTQAREGYVVAFVLPAGTNADTAPEPTDPAVRVRPVDGHLAAALRFSGRWTKSSFDRHLRALEREVRSAWLTPAGPPVFARFDPPFVPWPLRRNEVVVPVAEVPEST